MKKLTLWTDILTFLVTIIKFFVFTNNGNKKGYKCNKAKGLKVPNFSYLMRSSASSQGLPKPILIICDSFASRTTTELLFILMKSDENSWVCFGSINTTVHWAYRVPVFSLISNLKNNTDPGKKKKKSEQVHFLNIVEQNLTMKSAHLHTLPLSAIWCFFWLADCYPCFPMPC